MTSPLPNSAFGPPRFPTEPQTPREREALNARYVYYAVVVPLSDGSFGVFANDRSLESLVYATNVDDLALAITSRANMIKRKTPSKAPKARIDMSELFDEEEEDE